MRKLLISIALGATLSGCSSIDIDSDSWDLFGNVIPRSLEKLPFVYRPLIVQGNLITQDNVNQLKPGMHKKQVQLVMGTPLLQDVFHDQRWDYYYGVGIGKIELEKRLTLFFDDQDRLARIEGDYRPLPPLQGKGAEMKEEGVIRVPDWNPPPRTLFEQLIHTVGLEKMTGEGLRQAEGKAAGEQMEGQPNLESPDEEMRNEGDVTPSSTGD